MAFENFTTWTEVDGGSDLTVTSSRVTAVNMNRAVDDYVYYDMGAGHFSGDFEHLLTIYGSSAYGTIIMAWWGMANEIDDMRGIQLGSPADGIFVTRQDISSQTWFRIRAYNAGTASFAQWTGMSISTVYYLEIERDEAVGTYGTLYVRLFSDEERTTQVQAISLALPEKEDFRYIYVMQSYNNGGSPSSSEFDGYSEDLQLIPNVPVNVNATTDSLAVTTHRATVTPFQVWPTTSSLTLTEYPAEVLLTEPVFFDDFNRADSATVGNGWVEETAAVGEIASNKLKATAHTNNFWGNQLKAERSLDLQDGDIIAEFQFDTSLSGVPQIHGRAQGTDDNTFYLAYIADSGTTLNLAKYVSSSLTALATAASFSALSVGTNYRLTLSMDGSYIRADLYDLDTGTLIAKLGDVDTAITATGKSCLSQTELVDPILYDNFRTVPKEARKIHYWENFFDANNHIGHLTTAGTVAVATYANSKKLKLTGASASAKDSFYEPLDKYIIEIDLEAPAANQIAVELLNASNNVIVSCNMDGTTPEGSFDTDNSSPTTFTWAASTPKQIQILIDPSANTARCFYSTGTGSAGDDWPAVSAAKSYTGAAITQWRVKTPSGTTGDCYVDQIKIYNAGLAWLGDSITSGHGLSAGGVPEWGPNPDDNSRSRADEDPDHFLNTQYMLLKTTPEWSLGRGVDADESDELDARVTNDIINPGSTGCVIWVGTNDIGHGTLTLAQSKTNITSIIDKLQAGGMASSEIILVEVAPCNGFDAADNTYKDSLNAWLSTEALAQGTRIASIHDLLEDGGSPDDLLAAYDAGDGLHLSTAGLKVVAQEVIDANLNLNISTAVDALTLTEYSASVQLATTVDTAVDALTLAEYSASIQLHLTLDVTTDALVLTEYPVKVSFNKNVYATTDALVLAEQLVNIKLNKNIDATVDAIILTENLVDITVGGGEIEINAGVDPLVLSVYPVDIKLNKNVEVTTHALLLTDQGAGVNAGRNVLAGYDTLVLTEYTTGSGVPIIVLVERREFIADNERREFIADTVRREFIS